jgi:cell division protein FtsQ
MSVSPRLLHAAAGFLVGLALLAGAAAALHELLRPEVLPLRHVELAQATAHVTPAQVQAAVRSRVAGSFLAADLAAVRASVEALPWVRRASVRRVWPDRLEVSIEEHVALARWGERELVNTFGERFAGVAETPLPLFVAPPGSEGEVALRYRNFAAALEPLGTSLERVVLTQRYAWQLRLASGLHLMLGRDGEQAEARLRRFIAAYPALERKKHHEYVDLRYPNGFALRASETGS